MISFQDKIYFGKHMSVRLMKEHFDAIDELREKHPDKYSSISHIIRCGIIQLLNNEREREEKAYAIR